MSSSDTKTATASGGIGFFGLLAILFIGLKLAGVINWSWWWVLAPIWLPLPAMLVCFLVGFIIYLVISLTLDAFKARR